MIARTCPNLSFQIFQDVVFESQDNLETDAAMPSFGDDWAQKKLFVLNMCLLCIVAPAKGSDNSLVIFSRILRIGSMSRSTDVFRNACFFSSQRQEHNTT